MGVDTKKLRNRIKSVNSTLHITKAMGLVASSKMRKAMEGMNNGKKYESAVYHAIEPAFNCPEAKKSPFMLGGKGEKTCLILIAGDRGLAGGYNANIFRAVKEFENCEIIPIGKKACERYKQPFISAEKFDYAKAIELATKLCEDYKQGKYKNVAVLGTKYVSMLSQEPRFTEIFPLKAPQKASDSSSIFEPDEITIFNTIIPSFVAGILVSQVRESFASEIAARRCAMDSAGKNAQQMIDDLQLQYNRARQSAITQEITEIIAGSNS